MYTRWASLCFPEYTHGLRSCRAKERSRTFENLDKPQITHNMCAYFYPLTACLSGGTHFITGRNPFSFAVIECVKWLQIEFVESLVVSKRIIIDFGPLSERGAWY